MVKTKQFAKTTECNTTGGIIIVGGVKNEEVVRKLDETRNLWESMVNRRVHLVGHLVRSTENNNRSTYE